MFSLSVATLAATLKNRTNSQLLLLRLPQFYVGFMRPLAVRGHHGPHHNFVAYAPIILKFGTGMHLDLFYTVVKMNL